jgi:hypothetical protein
MDYLSLDEMKRLAAHQSRTCVSIYIPTHRRGRETEQDPIRFGNQLKSVEAELSAREMRRPDIVNFLAEANTLLEDREVWQHSQDGLAVFIDADEFHAYRLPFEVATRTVVADRYFLNPLLPLFTNNGHFFILALSLNEWRLFEGTRFTVGEIDKPADAPESIEEILGRYTRDGGVQARSAGSSPAMGSFYHGHGGETGDERKRVTEYLNLLDKALMPMLADSRAPLVVAGDVSLLPIYLEVTNYAHVVEEGPRGNPEMLSAKDLHEQTWPYVDAKFRADLEAVLSQYGTVAANGRAVAGLEAVVPAAMHGRVSIALLPPGLEVWGTVAEDTGDVTRTDESAAGALELEGFVATQTLLNGGEVYAVAQEEMPDQAEVAAILRF